MGQVTASIFYLIFILSPAFLSGQIRTGAENIESYYPLLKNKEIGVVANQASVVGSKSLIDVLVSKGFHVVRIFSPEHGFRMTGDAGELIGSTVDSITGIRIVSLYGKNMKPTQEDLESLDLILFDLQDVGVRFYTYISTLTYMMEACAEQNIPLILLDRPNPNGFYIDGPVLELSYRSFVGMHPVPVVYGMTIGEYALMVNGEGWLNNKLKCDLQIVPMEKYFHQMRYDLPVKPSPNLPNPLSVFLYPSLCFFEGTQVSVGRGTSFPFQVYGHPDLTYGTFFFTPESIPGVSNHPVLEGRLCRGEDLRNYDPGNLVDPGKIILRWLLQAYQGSKGKGDFFNAYFNKLAGNATLQQQIIAGKTEKDIRKSWQSGINKFKKIRQKYLLY
jgi:uncharacterized protein YbbC (DUF1343 family)